MGLSLLGSSGAVTSPFKNLPTNVQRWIESEGEQLWNISKVGRGEFDRQLGEGYQQYGGPRVADMHAIENEGIAGLRGLPGELAPIEAKINELGGLDHTLANNPEMIQKLYNPYQQDVIDATMGDLDVIRQREAIQRSAAAGRAGAFGGSRHGVADAVAMGERDRADAAILGGMRKEGWDTAAGLASGDLDRRATSSANYMDTLLGLYGQKGQMGLERSAGLLDAGATARGIEQGKMDVAYDDWNKEQNFVWDLIGKARAGTSNPATNANSGPSTSKGSTPGLMNVLGGGLSAGVGAYMARSKQPAAA